MRTYGLREKYYEQARELGVTFIRYDEETQARGRGRERTEASRSRPSIRSSARRSASPRTCWCLPAASTRIPTTRRLSQLFKVPLTANRFFLEAHAKLRPVDFATEGVFVCGMRALPQGLIGEHRPGKGRRRPGRHRSFARHASRPKGKTAFVRESRCVACGACVEVCPYHAIEIDPARNTAKINDARVQGMRGLRGHLPFLRHRPEGLPGRADPGRARTVMDGARAAVRSDAS